MIIIESTGKVFCGRSWHVGNVAICGFCEGDTWSLPDTTTPVLDHQQTPSNSIKHQRASANIIKHQQTSSNISEHQQTLANIIKHQRTDWDIRDDFTRVCLFL